MKIKRIVTAAFLFLLVVFVKPVLAQTAVADGNYYMGYFAQDSSQITNTTSDSTTVPSTDNSVTVKAKSILGSSAPTAPANITSNQAGIPSKDAVDISSYQSWMTQGDFNQLKADGVKTIIVKLTKGTNYVNPYALSQSPMAQAAGLNVAVYHFATFGLSRTSQTSANNEAVAEANFFANTARSMGLASQTVMVEDAEYAPDGPAYWDWTQSSEKFASELNTLGFNTVRYYCSGSWAVNNTGQMEPQYLGNKNMWVAGYPYGVPSASSLEYTWAGAWQYSSQMKFQGTSNLQNNFVDVSKDYSNTFVGTQPSSPSIQYTGQVQNIGWQGTTYDGLTAGTIGESLRMEAFKVNLANLPTSLAGSGLTYKAHVQNIGWQNPVSAGQMAGTQGQSLRMEALSLSLTGAIANSYDVYYRVQVQNIGWMGWAKNGAYAGTTGKSLRIESLQIKLVTKGGAAPGSTSNSFQEQAPAPTPPVAPVSPPTVNYQAQVQNIGWQNSVSNGAIAGTVGQSLRMEALKISLVNTSSSLSGGIQYQAHVQNIGWQTTVSNGAIAGTVGQSLRMEALKISLTGTLANSYDVWYRAQVQNIGWQPWIKDGAQAGTTGQSLRMESIRIEVLPKGSTAPSN